MLNSLGCRCGLKQAALLCALMLAARLPRALADPTSGQIAAQKINQRVIAALPKWHGKSATIVDQIDLTRPFKTRTRWTFVAALLPGSRENAVTDIVDSEQVAICFVNGLTPRCRYKNAYHFWKAAVVYAGRSHTDPLLLVKTEGQFGADGNHSIYTKLFLYDRRKQDFQAAFENMTYSNMNQETRFIVDGPLRGDVIVAVPTENAPYAYWISVYAPSRTGKYANLTLRYRSATRYNDGNYLAVIDSEMPNILKGLGKWKPGEALPIPSGLSAECAHPTLRRGEEWCPQ